MKLFNRVSRRVRGRERKRPAFHLNFELCEDRVLLAIMVTTAADNGDNSNPTTGSLRQAILTANSTTGQDTIDFNIPGSGPFIIQPPTALPSITDPVVIDGYTQLGAKRNSLANGNNAVLLIELNGASAPAGTDGLLITAGGSTVEGLAINRFGGAGVAITGSGATSNVVQGNFIGTDATGTAALGNGSEGVRIDNVASNNTIGGTTSGAGNVIADNLGFGVSLNAPASNNVILSNSIFSNESPGISIGPGVSVPAAPSLTLAQAFKTFTEIQGTYAGAASTTYLLEFFDNDARDPSGFGQGKKLVGSANVTIDAAGDPASFDLTNVPPLLIGHAITATATELQLVFISPGSVLSPRVTSGFSASAAVVGAFQVLNTADSGFGSLRQAIVNADQEPGPDTITFAIPGAGVHTINPASPLPRITDQVNLDGTTERTFLGLPAAGPPVIQLNGNGLPGDGLVLGSTPPGPSVGGTSSAGSAIIGLDIYNFRRGSGIHIQTNGNLITGNFLGTDVNGTAAGPGNQQGVLIDTNASGNTIGGTGAAGNVISGNSGDGIDISSDGNFVQGNKIGTNAAGTAALGNGTPGSGAGGAGVRLGGTSNTIANNVISANVNEGIFITVGGNMVLGNLIGTNAGGTAALGNGLSGITLQESADNLIRGNTLSGNGVNPPGGNGIDVAGSGSQNNLIEANFIGTDSAGARSLPNLGNGLFVTGPNNTIGGTGAGAGNVISGNKFQGLNIQGVTPGGNQVLGNFIGTNAAGTAALGNGFAGISLEQTTGNVFRGNVISGNGVGPFGGAGIDLTDSASQSNLIQANRVGTDASGARALPNIGDGISLAGPNNTIGGTGSGAGNVISGNTGDGIALNSGASFNSIVGNFIGTDDLGSSSLGNQGAGVRILGSFNTIGGTGSGAGNVISGNTGDGIALNSGASFNSIVGNFIGTDDLGSSSLGNQGAGVRILGSFNTIGGTGSGAGNVISGNVLDGIFMSSAARNFILGNVIAANGVGEDAAGINLESSDRNNIIAGNKIGTNAAGDAMLGNSLHGIFLGNGSSDNTIGGTTDNNRNVISGNGTFPVTSRTSASSLSTQGGVGVYIDGANTSGNVVLNNYIGTNVVGTAALPNSVIGVLISQSFGNTVQGNLISGNGFVGLEIAGGTASGNQVQGNKIGTNFDGTAAIPNGLDGITINNAPNNTIGGTTAGAGNLISGNGSVGIQLFGSLTQGNVIEGNALGLDSAGRPTLPNRAGGIFVNTGPLNNQVGGTAPDQANRGQTRQQLTVTGFHQSHAGSKTRHSPPAGRRFRIRGRARTSLRTHSVDSGQKLSHYRGQIEPPASLPRGATVGCFGELLSEEW